MDINLQEIWLTNANESVPPELAEQHLRALKTEIKPVAPLVHCNLYDGLFNGAPIEKGGINEQVKALLEALENAQRQIVLINTASSYGEEKFKEEFPNKNWELKGRLTTGREFFQRARGVDLPKGELIITHHDENSMPMDHRAHVSIINPANLAR